MITPKEITRSDRKTLALTVDRMGNLIVRAPFNLPEYEIYKFIEEKDDWIKSRINKVKLKASTYPDLISYQKFLLFGTKYKTMKLMSVKSAKFENGFCYVPNLDTQKELVHKVVLVYKRLANKWLKQRTDEISQAIGIKYNSFKVSDTKGRWGACTSKKEINLNFRVVCLAPALIDYVIVHELAHIKEMNHSPKFWVIVQSILPDYKKRRKAIKELNFLFEIYK